MTIRKNDLAVFTFMLGLVKCPVASASSPPAFAQASRRQEPKICQTEQGLVLNFEDTRTMTEIERKMTPAARRAVTEVLEHVEAVQAKDEAGLLQKATKKTIWSDDDIDDEIDDVGDSTAGAGLSRVPKPTTSTTPGLATPPVPKSKVVKDVSVEEGHFKCNSGPPDCGLLHDKMSLMWGSFKDLVDELQSEMDKNAWEFEELKYNLNQQLEVLRSSKSKFNQDLAEATGNLNADREELAEKEDMRIELEHEYKVYMAECRKRIEYIMFQGICAYLKVRATVMTFSKVSPPEKIVDCGVSAWVPGECSVPCDDSCPNKKNPYACGGWQMLTREIVVMNNEFGIACQCLSRQRKCGQKKCPVDCVQSKWSGWTKCTKECEGGVRGRTRSVRVQPKNGGVACNTASESEPCNTGSCDRNCRLKKWTKWSPCSVACGGGFQERFRRVLVPIRANGRCPKRRSRIRYGVRKCNSHDCRGDEVCIAKQDLVISIDSSGSLREKGFKILKDFSAGLID